MKLAQAVLVATAVLPATFAFGDSILVDPRAVFSPPSQTGGGGPPPSDITALSFSFTSPTGTSPGTSACVIEGTDDDVCDFLNISGVDWTQLQFTASPGGDLSSCEPIYGFTNCDVNQQGGSSSPTIFTFSGGTGIPDGVAFSVALEGWAAGTEFDVVANTATPEPSEAAFLLAGLLIVFASIKRIARASRTNSVSNG